LLGIRSTPSTEKQLDANVVRSLRGLRGPKLQNDAEESELMMDSDTDIELWEESDDEEYSAADLVVDWDVNSKCSTMKPARKEQLLGSDVYSEDVIDIDQGGNAIITFAPTHGVSFDKENSSGQNSHLTKPKSSPRPRKETSPKQNYLGGLICLPTTWLHFLFTIWGPTKSIEERMRRQMTKKNGTLRSPRHFGAAKQTNLDQVLANIKIGQQETKEAKEVSKETKKDQDPKAILYDIGLEDEEIQEVTNSDSGTTFAYNSEAENDMCTDGEEELFLSSKFGEMFQPRLELQFSRTTLVTTASITSPHMNPSAVQEDDPSFAIWPPWCNQLQSKFIRHGGSGDASDSIKTEDGTRPNDGLDGKFSIAWYIIDTSAPKPKPIPSFLERRLLICRRHWHDYKDIEGGGVSDGNGGVSGGVGGSVSGGSDIWLQELSWKKEAASRRRMKHLESIQRRQRIAENRRKRTRQRKRIREEEKKLRPGQGLLPNNLGIIQEEEISQCIT